MSHGPARSGPRWFQFTIRRMLAATFWVAITTAAYAIVLNETYGERIPMLTGLGLMFLPIAGPCIAIGALFGHAKRGAAVGTVLFFAMVLSVIMH